MIHRAILVVLGFFFIVSMAAAADLTPSTMTSSSSGWLVANGNDQSTITVHVLQGSPATDVSGATVAFSLAGDSSDLGTLSAQSVVTGPDGLAQTVFRTSTKSGTATINALLTYNDGSVNTLPLSCVQKIDHDTPWDAEFSYQHDVPVGSVTRLTIRLVDISGNPADNKNPAETHTILLHMSGDGGSGLLKGTGYVQDLSVPTDASGTVSVDLRVSTQAGLNIVQVYPVGSYLGEPVTINGVAESNPFYLVQVHPSPSSYPADGKDPDHRFTFYWTVLDRYQNPVENADLYVTSSKAGEEVHLSTNAEGMASTPYGPKDIAGVYTITAKPVVPGTTTALNSTILCTDTGTNGYCSQTVEYLPMDPVDMILTASPQTMVSMDVDGAKAVDVKARVVDSSGNAVKGQTVTFEKSADSYPTFTETAQSSLSSLSAATGDSGYATVQFVPGTFAKKSESGYNEAATGTCKVTAKWVNPKTAEIKSREITFVWKNYPFLTVESEIDKTDPKVGDIINVKVWIRGTGAALQPKAIDVVLCNDRSGSMLYDSPDRMVTAKDAAQKFSAKLTEGKDHIGIVSFGDTDSYSGIAALAPVSSGTSWDWDNVYYASSYYLDGWYWVADDSAKECGSRCSSYGSSRYDPSSAHQQYLNAHYNNGNPQNYGYGVHTHQDLSLDSHTQTEVTDALNGIVPAGGTPMREGLYSAVNMFPAYSAERPIRAIILLTDGVYSTGQNPEGGSGSKSLGNGVGTGSVITYAKNNKIKIFTIGLGSDADSDELTRYATATGGKYYSAGAPAELANIYTDIAGALNEQAGGQTQLITDFSKITVDGNLVTGNTVGEYLEYVYTPGGGTSSSTYITKYTEVPVTPPKNTYYTLVRDDTGNWTNPTTLPGLTSKKLEFDVGKIILNDVWMTNIQFRLKKAGQIGIFGENSPVTFIDAVTGKSQTVTVPSKTWTTHQSLVNNPFVPTAALLVKDVAIAGSTTDPGRWTVSWNTVYEGSSTVHEKLLYCSESGTTPVPCSGTSHTEWLVIPQSVADKSAGTTPDSVSIDTSLLKMKSGETYRITVWAETYGEKEASDYALHAKTDGSVRPFIKLE
nr:VWA domain-containing protein [uncultured Methanoregula sp.]